MTPAEVFKIVQQKVEQNPAKIANLKASYLFELTGESGGLFHAVIDNGSAKIGEGAIPDPGCTITMAAADFMKMIEGKLNPMAAFMGGKLKVRGDMTLALKLQQLIG